MRYLLNKGVIRSSAEGLRNFVRGRRLTLGQREAIAVLQLHPNHQLFASNETWNLLMRRDISHGLIQLITNRTKRFVPRRYQRRWARRLRQHFGFEREDAHQLALATLGSDENSTVLGVNALITFDRRLINRFYTHHSQIETKLRRMTAQLHPPYSQAILPELATPGEILST